MKYFHNKTIHLLLTVIFSLICVVGCKKDSMGNNDGTVNNPGQTTPTKTPNPYSFIKQYKTTSTNLDAIDLQMTVRSDDKKGTFYLFGDFDAEKKPKNLAAVAFIKDGSDTTYNYIVGDNLDIKYFFISVKGVADNKIFAYDYSATGASVNFISYDWKKNTGASLAKYDFSVSATGQYSHVNTSIFSPDKVNKAVMSISPNKQVAGVAPVKTSLSNNHFYSDLTDPNTPSGKLARSFLKNSILGIALGTVIAAELANPVTWPILAAFILANTKTILQNKDAALNLFIDLIDLIDNKLLGKAYADETVFYTKPTNIPVKNVFPDFLLTNIDSLIPVLPFLISDPVFKKESIVGFSPILGRSYITYILYVECKLTVLSAFWDSVAGGPVFGQGNADPYTLPFVSYNLSSDNGHKESWYNPYGGFRNYEGTISIPLVTYSNIKYLNGGLITATAKFWVDAQDDTQKDFLDNWKGNYYIIFGLQRLTNGELDEGAESNRILASYR